MSINLMKLIELNNLVALKNKSKSTIILDPKEKKFGSRLSGDIEYDKAEWKIPNELKDYVSTLSEEKNMSTEDKILKIYEKICNDYVYDDNLISYIKKVDVDTFHLPDWYGRDIDKKWEKNREEHNRRICFELSRYLAKSLNELLKKQEGYNVCIHWNKELTHYFVGLISNEYSVILDVDDFYSIKDLTRIKANLTAEGIKILKDKNGKFASALEKFNEGREKYSISKIENESEKIENNNETENDTDLEENEEVIFLQKAMKILSEDEKLDSQGIFEYMKEIIDIGLGQSNRKKIWKEIPGQSIESTRHIRCLVVNIDDNKYLIDGDEKIMRKFDEREFKSKNAKYKPYNEVSKGDYDYYNGK